MKISLMNNIDPNYKSYKDSAARVVRVDNKYYRYIFEEYREEYDYLVKSGLYKHLVDSGLLISHVEVDIKRNEPLVYKLILPEQIKFQSYPYEWSFEQWKEVVKCFLHINLAALDFGMILKDATPFNFYFKEGNCILFDTSSFVKFNKRNVWTAYRQFCEELLAPLALIYYSGQLWSKIYQTQIKGIPLAFVSNQLPFRSWFNFTCLFNLHFHSKFDNEKLKAKKTKNKGFTVDELKTFLNIINKQIYNWNKPYNDKYHWSKYYKETIESESYLSEKEKVINKWLSELDSSIVLDLGANTGRFSRIAAQYSNYVLALESDPVCVDIIHQMIKNEKISNMSTFVGDLSLPTPSLGLFNKEIDSLFERLNSDVVMALALIHHLYFTNLMSMVQIVELFSMLTTKYVIVEFIPFEDDKVKILLNNKERFFSEYSESFFLKQFEVKFILINSSTLLKSKRKLFLFQKNSRV